MCSKKLRLPRRKPSASWNLCGRKAKPKKWPPKLHAAFLNESRIRGYLWCPVQEIRISGPNDRAKPSIALLLIESFSSELVVYREWEMSAQQQNSTHRPWIIGTTSLFFILLQSACTAVMAISGVRVIIGLGALPQPPDSIGPRPDFTPTPYVFP